MENTCYTINGDRLCQAFSFTKNNSVNILYQYYRPNYRLPPIRVQLLNKTHGIQMGAWANIMIR